MTTYEIDGEQFATLEEFYGEVDRVMHLSAWGHNLDAFNDILRGGFGTPEGGFAIRWKNHQVSRDRLGYTETIRQLKLRLQRCHPAGREKVLGSFWLRFFTVDLNDVERRGRGRPRHMALESRSLPA